MTHEPTLTWHWACPRPDEAPDQAWCQAFIQAALAPEHAGHAVHLELVGLEAMTQLNHQFRGQNKPTNILSFVNEAPILPDGSPPALGDLVLCVPLVAQEAQAQHKVLAHHWAHLLVHGTLHLQGWDHENDTDAQAMEAHEIALLAQAGLPNPYEDHTS